MLRTREGAWGVSREVSQRFLTLLLFFFPLEQGISYSQTEIFLAVTKLNSHTWAACHMVWDTAEMESAEGVSAKKWVMKIVGLR